jgi:hypothetical protein
MMQEMSGLVVVRCPTTPAREPFNGDPSYGLGCGHVFAAVPDEGDGMVDCYECGLFFDPVESDLNPAALGAAARAVLSFLSSKGGG